MCSAVLDVNIESGRIFINEEACQRSIVAEDAIAAPSDIVCIQLDARAQSDLNWEQALQRAEGYVQAGHLLLWELELGLFKDLSASLDDQAQFSALSLGIEHFAKTVWPRFAAASIGASLYRGSIDTSNTLVWSPKQEDSYTLWLADLGIDKDNATAFHMQLFCRDASAQYLELLTSRLPATAQAFAFIDFSDIHSPWQQALLASPESFEYIHIISDAKLPGLVVPSTAQDSADAALGICLPCCNEGHAMPAELWQSALEACQSTPYRIVPELNLTTLWHGLDELIVFSDHLSPLGLRKLQGFCAAGGMVLTLGPPLGLAIEGAAANC
ncbi:MAG: hypothetical protein KDK78_04995 [Chlamydiia bacterium]|nr:hypothetical protein [Chlamydiia bacterium]